jgi:hypothetical protein
MSTATTINNYCTLSQVKRKLKAYLCDISHEYLKINNYGQSIVFTLVDMFNEIITDSLKYVSKNDITGLYKLNTVIVKLVINEMSKYHFLLKYLPKFNTSINYQDLLLFNYKKTLQFIENNLGNKLMIEYSTLNLISYLLLSLQYDLINLSVLFVDYSKKKTLSKNTLLNSVYSLLDEELSSKIKLKLDCAIQEKECAGEEEEEGDEEEGDEEEGDEEEETEVRESKVEVKESEKKVEAKESGKKVEAKESGKKMEAKESGKKVEVETKESGKKAETKDSGKKVEAKAVKKQ